jgi:hypothetical protein
MSEREEFITWVHTVLKDAEVAVHNGHASPRRATWSRNDPVTVLGAWRNAKGQAELGAEQLHPEGDPDLSAGRRRVEGGAPTRQRAA